MRILLISTYELGHQPFGLASPAAWLRREGLEVECADTTRHKLSEVSVKHADLIAFYLPMHTATRIAVPLIARVRQKNPRAQLIAFGLYAPLNEELLRKNGVEYIIGGEFELALVEVARSIAGGARQQNDSIRLDRLNFVAPDRDTLPPLQQYARLSMPDGAERICGYTEASRGCKHVCR